MPAPGRQVRQHGLRMTRRRRTRFATVQSYDIGLRFRFEENQPGRLSRSATGGARISCRMKPARSPGRLRSSRRTCWISVLGRGADGLAAARGVNASATTAVRCSAARASAMTSAGSSPDSSSFPRRPPSCCANWLGRAAIGLGRACAGCGLGGRAGLPDAAGAGVRRASVGGARRAGRGGRGGWAGRWEVGAERRPARAPRCCLRCAASDSSFFFLPSSPPTTLRAAKIR